jgi:hypothetical protein
VPAWSEQRGRRGRRREPPPRAPRAQQRRREPLVCRQVCVVPSGKPLVGRELVALAEAGPLRCECDGRGRGTEGVSPGIGSPAARAVRGERGLAPSRSRVGTGVRFVRFRYSCTTWD